MLGPSGEQGNLAGMFGALVQHERVWPHVASPVRRFVESLADPTKELVWELFFSVLGLSETRFSFSSLFVAEARVSSLRRRPGALY